jgi:alkylation response protein AidB-like acyl-CoA dehydrogenase
LILASEKLFAIDNR